MQTGILVCGLNGSGKSTLGKTLAEALGYTFMDNEDLFFAKSDPNYFFASPRSRAEAEKLLAEAVQVHPRFVFAAVLGDYGEEVMARYRCAVWVETPRETRLQRVRQRSFQRFGERMLPGGDLYAQEASFFETVAARPEQYVAQWIPSLRCPVLRVDGTRPVSENVSLILRWLKA